MIDLANISLFDILSAPTQERTMVEEPQEVNENDFAPETFARPEMELPEIEEEPYDARANAESLVNTIDAVNAMALSMVGHWKLTKNIGGKKAVKRMRTAYIKANEGTELTDVDKQQLQSFETYKTDMKLLNMEVRFSDLTREMLIKNATTMCEESKYKFNKNMTFWTILLTTEVEKIYKIVTL